MTIYRKGSATPTAPEPEETGTWIVRYTGLVSPTVISEAIVFAPSAAHAAWDVAGSWSEGWFESMTLVEVVPMDRGEAQQIRAQYQA
jgi:hypothetical protein